MVEANGDRGAFVAQHDLGDPCPGTVASTTEIATRRHTWGLRIEGTPGVERDSGLLAPAVLPSAVSTWSHCCCQVQNEGGYSVVPAGLRDASQTFVSFHGTFRCLAITCVQCGPLFASII